MTGLLKRSQAVVPLQGRTSSVCSVTSVVNAVSKGVDKWRTNAELVRQTAEEAEKEKEPPPAIETLPHEQVCTSALAEPECVVKQWTDDDVVNWLVMERCPVDLDAFKTEGVDGATLLQLNEANLKDMGVPKLSDRKLVMAAIKKLAYYELYPELLDNVSKQGDVDNCPSTRASTRQSSKEATLGADGVDESGIKVEFEPVATSFVLKVIKRFTYLYGCLCVGWEVLMNICAFHPMLHMLALIPGTLWVTESLAWWYRVWLMCASQAKRNKVTNWAESKQYFVDHANAAVESAQDTEEEIFMTWHSVRVFRGLTVAFSLITVITIALITTLNIPPGVEGAAELCGLLPSCNGRGVCASDGVCWCTIGLYNSEDGCSSISVSGGFALGVLVAVVLYTLWVGKKWYLFKCRIKKLERLLKDQRKDFLENENRHKMITVTPVPPRIIVTPVPPV